MTTEKRTAVITGGYAGIGLELSKLLLSDGWRLMLVRRPGSGEEAIRDLRSQYAEAEIETFEADLADQAAIQSVANRILERAPKIEVLFNNAGVLLEKLQYSPQQIEMHFQINTLAPYMLMRLLRPALASSKGICVNTSSAAIMATGKLRLEQLKSPARFRKLFGSYGQSKLALAAVTNALAPDYASDGVVLRNVDPGGNRTGMTRGAGMPAAIRWLLVPLLFASPKKGANLVYQGAIDPKFERQTGIYISGGKITKQPADAVSIDMQKQVLGLCQGLTGI